MWVLRWQTHVLAAEINLFCSDKETFNVHIELTFETNFFTIQHALRLHLWY